MEKNFEILSDQEAKEQLDKSTKEAEKLLKDPDKIERFLQRLEKKLKIVPLVGDKLSHVPVMASLVRLYVKKEYTDIPIGSILAILGALIYFVSPIDIIPDSIPVVGYLDDAFVIGACWTFVASDVEDYIKWRKENGLEIDD